LTYTSTAYKLKKPTRDTHGNAKRTGDTPDPRKPPESWPEIIKNFQETGNREQEKYIEKQKV
jgi:hypothetical protein